VVLRPTRIVLAGMTGATTVVLSSIGVGPVGAGESTTTTTTTSSTTSTSTTSSSTTSTTTITTTSTSTTTLPPTSTVPASGYITVSIIQQCVPDFDGDGPDRVQTTVSATALYDLVDVHVTVYLRLDGEWQFDAGGFVGPMMAGETHSTTSTGYPEAIGVRGQAWDQANPGGVQSGDEEEAVTPACGGPAPSSTVATTVATGAGGSGGDPVALPATR
jgi:hypothetical protein